jgi:thymidylate synthase
VTDKSQQRHMDETKRPTTPCLLGIDTKVIQGKDREPAYPGEPSEYLEQFFLTFYVMYRSWDLFGGFPENMGGFQLLKERMAAEISAMSGKVVKPGPSMVFCKDLHLYGSRVEAAKAWLE